MKPVLTAREMSSLEARAIEGGLSSLELMRRASLGVVARLIEARGPLFGRRVYVACGRGNNGGDGWGAAYYAHLSGARVTVVDAGPLNPDKHDALSMRARALGEGVGAAGDWTELPKPDIWIDALYGIGLHRPIEGRDAALIDRIDEDRRRGAYVVSVDVPSGLNADTGRAEGRAVEADLTVTFGFFKRGHYMADGLDRCGRAVLSPIGLEREPVGGALGLIEDEDALRALPARRRNVHKGDYGRLMIVAGAMGLCGAAIMAARAALRFGTGLVTLAVPRGVVPIAQTAVPGAMALPLPEKDGTLSAEAAPILSAALAGKDALVIGPGLGQAAPEAVEAALNADIPAVVDADALNIISRERRLVECLSEKRVITPHPGEAARLLGRPVTDPVEDARALRAMTGAVVLLKGASSVIAGENCALCASGCGGMATGGSGDVLSGMIGALLAQGVEPERAAISAAHIHGLSGRAAADELTETAMTAMDIITHIPTALKKLSDKYGRAPI